MTAPFSLFGRDAFCASLASAFVAVSPSASLASLRACFANPRLLPSPAAAPRSPIALPRAPFVSTPSSGMPAETALPILFAVVSALTVAPAPLATVAPFLMPFQTPFAMFRIPLIAFVLWNSSIRSFPIA